VQPEQRAALLAAKLRALVTDKGGEWRRDSSELEPSRFGAGAALTDASGTTAWLLVGARPAAPSHIDDMPDEPLDPNPHGWLSGAALWAKRRGVAQCHVLLDSVSGSDARRARCLGGAIGLWQVVGRGVTTVATQPLVLPPASEDQLAMFGTLIAAAGAEVVVDQGTVRAEVLGLEVARVVVGEDHIVRLDVGVGKHDRLANAMLGERDPAIALTNAVEAVRTRRTADAGHHPANQLASERWLRCVVAANAGLVGLNVELLPISGNRAAKLKHPSPALLLGTQGGEQVLVACTTGVDLDAPVDAADVRSLVAPGARIVLAIPESDAVPAMYEVASLIDRCEVVTVPNTWPSLSVPPPAFGHISPLSD
jgi:hypothetical protein